MTATVAAISFDRLSSPMRQYLSQRAANYDYYTARDLWSDIPSELHHSEDAMMSFLRGNDALGLEPREIMHQVSEFNGGLDVPDNLMLGPRGINRGLGSNDMSDALIEYVEGKNDVAVDVLLDADPSILAEAWEATTVVASTAIAQGDAIMAPLEGAPIGDGEVIDLTAGELVELGGTPELVPAAEGASEIAAEAGGSLIGDAASVIADGLVPAMAAYKVGSWVNENCDSADVDPTAAGWAAAGGTVLLYCNPVTGPLAWGASGLYAGFKLFQLGAKVVDHLNQPPSSGQTVNVTAR